MEASYRESFRLPVGGTRFGNYRGAVDFEVDTDDSVRWRVQCSAA